MLPVPITLDFSRDYKFSGLFLNTNPLTIDSFADVFAIASTVYISQLIKSVVVPPREIQTDPVQISTTTVPLPRRYVAHPFDVTFIEDSGGLVYAFMNAWQERGRGSSGLDYREIGNWTMGFAFSNTVDIPALSPLSEIPVNVTFYPYVFPTRIERGEYDRSGDNFAFVKVTFSRFVRLAVPRLAAF